MRILGTLYYVAVVWYIYRGRTTQEVTSYKVHICTWDPR